MPRKRWNAEFFSQHRKNRTSCETLFVEGLEQNDVCRTLQDAFLQDSEISGPSWEVEQVQKFFREAGAIPDAKIWIDLRVRGIETGEFQSRWLESSDLAGTRKEQVYLTQCFLCFQLLRPLVN